MSAEPKLRIYSELTFVRDRSTQGLGTSFGVSTGWGTSI